MAVKGDWSILVDWNDNGTFDQLTGWVERQIAILQASSWLAKRMGPNSRTLPFFAYTSVSDVNRDWFCIACNSDGSFVVAGVYGGPLFVSDDYGVTWTEVHPAYARNQYWFCADCSDDGSFIVVAAAGGRLYTSSDYGATWTEHPLLGDANQYWRSVACDSDGSHVVAATFGYGGFNGRLFTSSDYGENWTERQPAGDNSKLWIDVATDDDGSHILAAVQGGRLYLSSNGGASWSEKQPDGNNDRAWYSVALDADGSVAVACQEHTDSGHIYISQDSGGSWTERDPLGQKGFWADVKCSSNGSTIVAVPTGKSVCISTNTGLTWAQHQPAGADENWRRCAVDSLGSVLYVCAEGGRMYSYSAAIDDISSYVLAARWSYGRDYDSHPIGGATAGDMQIRLKNADGRFSSFNSSSPLYGFLLPNRKVGIKCTYGGSTETMQEQYLRRIEPEPRIGGNGEAELSATGAIAKIADKICNIALQQDVRPATVVGEILDDAGWDSDARDIDRGLTILPLYSTEGSRNVVNTIEDIERAEHGHFRESKSGTLVFEDRSRRRRATLSRLSQGVFRDDGLGDCKITRLVQHDHLDMIYNEVTARVRQFETLDSDVLWSMEQDSEKVPAIPASGESLEVWAEFPNPSSEKNAFAVLAWENLVAGTDYAAHSDPFGQQTDMTGSLSVSYSKFDNAMKIVLTNNHPTDVAYITTLQARGSAILENDDTVVTKRDAASQAKYGVRPYPIPSDYLGSIDKARTYCNYILELYKNPHPILELEYRPTRNAAEMAEMMSRELGDRITVIANQDSQLGVSGEFIVERISHSLILPQDHVVSYLLSPAEESEDLIIFGTSQFGGTGVFGSRLGW